jgi:endonuclease-3
MENTFDISSVVRRLHRWSREELGKDYRRGFGRSDPYRVLVSTIIGLQTRGAVAHRVSEALWARASTPQEILAMPQEELAAILKSSGRSGRKAAQIQATTEILRDEYDWAVPNNMGLLTSLPGVGRKTANLVIEIGFGEPAMCVDTHVHRINNHWGWIHTRNPDETERVLRERLPRRLWRGFNPLLVTFGNRVCWPTSPKCSICPVADSCQQVGVSRKR